VATVVAAAITGAVECTDKEPVWRTCSASLPLYGNKRQQGYHSPNLLTYSSNRLRPQYQHFLSVRASRIVSPVIMPW
jgi:hypothetical protein